MEGNDYMARWILVIFGFECHGSFVFSGTLTRGLLPVIARVRGVGVSFASPRCVRYVVVQVDNATPIVLNREKSVILGIPGTAAW